MRFHIVKRHTCPWWNRALMYLAAVTSALIFGGLLLYAMDVNPFDYYKRMFTMGMEDARYPLRNLENYLKIFVPLALTSVALSLAFKMRFWNIGGEGQFIMGAISASAVALKLGGVLPQWLVLVLMCVAAMLTAGLYGAFVAVLKVKFGTNETLMTLMLNYVALYVLLFLGESQADWNFFLDKTSVRPVFANFGRLFSLSFPTISLGEFNLNSCVLFTLGIGVLIHIYLKYTKRGYEINVVGDSANTAHYAGMKVNSIVLRTVFLSACLIGLAASFKVGTAGILSTSITDDVGWTGVIVAWLAQLNTFVIFIASALISMLHFGASVANATFSRVDSSFADMLQGAILFAVLTAEFFVRFRIVRTQKGGSTHG